MNITTIPKSTWVWNAYSLQDVDLSALREQHVKKIYVQVEKEVPVTDYVAFSEQAKKYGIRLYALDGASTWASNPKEARATRAWIEAAQQQYQLFAGVHLDIEPYTLLSYENNKQQLFENYFAILKSYRAMTKNYAMKLEADIPFWYDEERYDNRYGKGLVSEFLIRQTDEVAVMAYRNNARHIIDITKSERAYAMKKGKNITIAVETHPSEEGDNISFANKSRYYFERQLEKVYAETKQPIGIHFLQSWQALYQ